MKESGVDWIGQIPEEWEVVRLQDVGDYKKGPFGSAITIDMFIEKSPGSYKVYEQKNAIRGNCEIGEAYIPKSVYNNLKNFSVYPLDIIVSCAGTIGKCYILPEDCEQGIINQALMRVRVNKSFNLEYFLYIFDIVLSYAAIKYSNGSAIKNIPPFNVLNKLRVTLPSNIEQLQIVNYLDKKTALLDKAKALLEEQIQKLKDYRASLIYETVTKGLDKTVPMKDSGIDWIGQVPEGWGVKRLKDYVDFQTGTTPPQSIGVNQERKGVRWFKPGDFSDESVDLTSAENFITSEIVKQQKLSVYPEKTILVVGIASIGKVGYSENFSYSNQQITALKVTGQIFPKYLAYLMFSSGQYIRETALYTIVPIINNQYLSSLKIVLPNRVVQETIVEYLDKRIGQINKMIVIKNKQIENIDKQRQTLIYDYVTGKRRV